jgi:hypothetical protein
LNYKKLLLNQLLEKYESSRAYLSDGQSSRRILLNICGPDFPEYNIENNERRRLINSVISDLKQDGLVDYEWMKHEKENIIYRVWLNLDNIDLAYKEADCIPKLEKVNSVLDIIREYQVMTVLPWLKEFLAAVEANIVKRKSLTPLLSVDVIQAKAILEALMVINGLGEEECLERVFSIKCYKDSKYFEKNTRNRVVGIIGRYLMKEDYALDTPSDDEVLALVGIVRHPEHVEFCGNITGTLLEKSVDFSMFEYGATINSHDIAKLKITGLPHIKHVVFIENKANYLDYILNRKRPDELVIWHGGFYSPARGLFFRKVYEAGCAAGIEYQHWSDIDLGGFRIFHRLKANIIPELIPMQMDRNALLSAKGSWVSFKRQYERELEKLLGLPEYAEFHDVIEVMLAEKAKLEQEAFLL